MLLSGLIEKVGNQILLDIFDTEFAVICFNVRVHLHVILCFITSIYCMCVCIYKCFLTL